MTLAWSGRARLPASRIKPGLAAPDGLRDIIAEDLSVLFCGINPGLAAAASQHHFSGRGNRFWRALHLSGFTPVQLTPCEDRALLRFGCGLTAMVARPTRCAREVSRQELVAAAAGFARKVEQIRPGFVAFLGKAAFSALADRRVPEWGLQPETIGASQVWVLPNPSGRNRAFSLERLSESYAAFHAAVAGSARS